MMHANIDRLSLVKALRFTREGLMEGLMSPKLVPSWVSGLRMLCNVWHQAVT